MSAKTVTLTDGDQHLIREVLQYAESHMSSAGCNDTPLSWLDGFTDSELVEIHGFIEGGNGPMKLDRHNRAEDFQYVIYLEELLAEGKK